MNRRGFLKALTAAVAGVAAYEADPDRLLWVPGAKTIFLPPAKKVEAVPTIVEPDADYLTAIFGTDGDLGIDVDLSEGSYQNAIRGHSTFKGIRHVRVFDGDRLLRSHAGQGLAISELERLRNRMYAVDAEKQHDRMERIAEYIVAAKRTRLKERA